MAASNTSRYNAAFFKLRTSQHWARVLLTIVGLTVAAAVKAAPHVYVSATVSPNDQVGQRLIYQVRELIRKSSGMELTEAPNKAFMTLTLVTMQAVNSSGVTPTAFAQTLSVVNPFDAEGAKIHLSTSVGVCGSDMVAQCAEATVADTEDYVVKYLPVVQKIILDNGLGPR